MVKVGDIWVECNDVKITEIEINNFCKYDTHDGNTLRGIGFNGCRLLSDLRKRH